MFDDGKKYEISSRMFAIDPGGESERIKEHTRRKFGQDFIFELLKFDSPVVVSLKESEYFDREQYAFRDAHMMEKTFNLSAYVTPVEYKTVIVEVPRYKYVHVKAPFWRRIKWMVTGE